jgi:hypothetical protein
MFVTLLLTLLLSTFTESAVYRRYHSEKNAANSLSTFDADDFDTSTTKFFVKRDVNDAFDRRVGILLCCENGPCNSRKTY